jgi:hypothetical protein
VRTNTCQGCGKLFLSQRKRRCCPGKCSRLRERAYGVAIFEAASPQRKLAHNLVSRALERGHLVRQPCEVCKAGRAVAHHDDYAAPLDVRWLCRSHHQLHHNQFGPGKNATQGETA